MEASRHILKIFYCYAREDKAFRDELETHLFGLRRQQLITTWSDREIDSGIEWEKEIDTHLNTSHLILLLVSPNFLASDYCYGIEMKRALERHEAGDVCVIPIIIRPVHWQDAPFSKLEVLPTEAKPVSRWPDRDDAWFDVVKGIREVIKALQSLLVEKEKLLKEALVEEGEELLDQEQYEEALTKFDKAIALDEEYGWAIALRAETYRLMERYKEALADFDRAIELNDKDGWNFARRGETYRLMKRYEEALADFDRAIALSKKINWFWYHRALTHLLTFNIYNFVLDTKNALDLTLTKLKQKPGDYSLAFDVALFHLLHGHFHDAEVQYADLIANCSSILKLQDATEDLADFLEIQPKHEIAQKIYGQLQKRIDELK